MLILLSWFVDYLHFQEDERSMESVTEIALVNEKRG
jgi:hypothetical protein